MMDIAEAKRMRGRAKAALTRILSSLDDNSLSEIDLNIRLERLDAIWQEFTQYDSALPEDQSEMEEFENKFFETKSRIKTALNVFETSTASNITISQASVTTSNIKLPRLNIPKFSGKYIDWLAFKDLFSVTIHNNNELSNVHKFQYLKGLLAEEPAMLIRNIPVSENSYHEAWLKLVNRYDKRKQIASALMKTFLDQSPVLQASEMKLRRIADVSDEVIRGLDSLSEDARKRDPWLIHLMLTKLDLETQQLWSQKTVDIEFPTLNFFIEFLNQRCSALAGFNQNVSKAKIQASRYAPELRQNSTPLKCLKCRGAHPLYKCSKFIELDVSARRNFIRKNELCFNCLKSDHKVYSCNVNSVCRYCSQKHHSMLHENIQNNYVDTTKNEISDQISPNPESKESDISTHSAEVPKAALLPTALVSVLDASGTKQNCRVLLDSGSQASFVSESCVQRLGLKRSNNRITVKGLGSNESMVTKGSVILSLVSLHDENDKLTVQAYILNKLTAPLPRSLVDTKDWQHIKSIKLADPSFATPQKTDIILGADCFFYLLRSGKILNENNKLIAHNTMFGWVLSGTVPIDGRTEKVYENSCLLSAHVDLNVDQILKQFWETEEIPLTNNNYTEEQLFCENHFKENFGLNPEGRFVVKLPFIKPVNNLENNKENALTRLRSMERKFKANKKLEHEYIKFMREYESLGHMVPVENSVNNECMFYLPHHAVFRESSSTTKLRVVFDGTCRNNLSISLNSMLGVGKTIQRDIFSILVSFRTHAIVFNADIEKMYRQILVAPEDRKYQRIVWRDDVNSNVKEYELCTVTYGLASAPFLATRALLQIAMECEINHPDISKIIRNDFYMDDLLSGASNLSEAKRLISELNRQLQDHGFHLRKWKSNHVDLLKEVISDKLENSEIEIDTNLECSKILGLYWDAKSDSFMFKVNIDITNNITKRELLSKSSRVFDPLGWLSPCTISIKILYQQLWLVNVDWDDNLPKKLADKWKLFAQEINNLSDIRISRWLYTDNDNFQLHGFSDASESACAAVIYCRSVYNGEIKTNIIVAKTKVSPIKAISIPRMELNGALLLARLYKALPSTFRENIQYFAWTDSKVVLAWLNSHPRRWKIFIANRTTEILEVIPRENWNYVPTKQNPADLPSRGIRPSQLKESTLWWNGPNWLKEHNSSWPHTANDLNFFDENATILDEERPKSVHCLHVNQLNDTLSELFNRHSSLSKILRIVAYCKRFIRKCKDKENSQNSIFKRNHTKPLNFSEIDESLKLCIRWIQENSFHEDLQAIRNRLKLHVKSKLRSLSPFLDDDGILRVGGRLHYSKLSYSAKHPVILPSNHKISELLIQQFHITHLHAGITLLSNILRQNYWIIRSKKLIRSIINRCVTCSRYRAVSLQQKMGDLPEFRVTPSRPFLNCGVDYAGPIKIKMHKGRGSKTSKAYIALFVCLATKAVHVELVSDLTTEAFIATLRRFSARRGAPSRIYSDNATNFVGAKHKLHSIYKFTSSINTDANVCYYLSQIACEWHMIPPNSPHFGGIWESGIRSVKFHLRRVIGDTILTFEEMSTFLAQIEAILNSRPLSAINTEDPDNLDALTPAHFLIGEILVSPPEHQIDLNVKGSFSRWELVQRLKQSFWKRWQLDYLNTLQHRNKWKEAHPNVSIGDLVILREDGIPPATWPLGRILQTHEGADGNVRVVTLKTAKGQFKRAITKLIKLSIQE